jgi:hypothetical protein
MDRDETQILYDIGREILMSRGASIGDAQLSRCTIPDGAAIVDEQKVGGHSVLDASDEPKQALDVR